MARASQTQDSYARGILQRKSPREQASGFLTEALNVVCVGGVLASRPGIRPFNMVEFPAEVRGHAWHVREDGSRIMLIAAGTAIYTCIEGGDPVALALTGMPTDERTRVEPEHVYFLSLSGGTNTTFIYDGVNPNLKFDGTNLSRMGIKTPTAAAMTNLHISGNINTGLHKYVRALVTPHSESSPSEVPTEVTATAPSQFKATSPAQTADFDNPAVTKWRLYGTVAGGSAFRFIDEADIGVDLTVNLTDATLGTRDPVEFFVNNPPPAPAVVLCEHRGQLAGVFADDTNLIRFTNLDPDFMVPESWPEDFVQPVAHSDGDELTALVSLDEWLIAFKNHAMYAIAGASFEEYKVVPVVAAAGGKRIGSGVNSMNMTLQVENAVLYVSRDAVSRVTRFEQAYGGIKPDRISGPIDDLITAAKFALGAFTFFDRNHRLAGFGGHG
jgi:hypothetical protein